MDQYIYQLLKNQLAMMDVWLVEYPEKYHKTIRVNIQETEKMLETLAKDTYWDVG